MALVGALEESVNGQSEAGAAFVFRNLDTASGVVTPSAEFTASDGAEFIMLLPGSQPQQ